MLLVAVVTLVTTPAAAQARGTAPGTHAQSRCSGDTTPIVRTGAHRIAVRRDGRGRVRCRAVPARRPPAPSAAPVAQAGKVADALLDVAQIAPRTMGRLERAVGRRRAQRLLDVALGGWRASAHAAANETTSFSPKDGIEGTATFGVEQAGGDQSGFTASATAELTATRAGVAKLSSSASEKLPADVTGARAKLAMSFADVATACPSAGKLPGRLKASGSVKVTVERRDGPPLEMELEATIETSYTAKVGDDGRWTGIDGVEVQTTFRSAASGEATQTYRGRRVGTGFGPERILGAKDIGTAIERDAGLLDANQGGVFGPKGSWNFARGIGLNDLRSVDNVKAMLSTAVATNLLTLAAVEYLRTVTLARTEKNDCAGRYKVTLSVNGKGAFATHEASGRLLATLDAAPESPSGGAARRWTGTTPVAWEAVAYTSKVGCPFVAPVSTGSVTVQLELTGTGSLHVAWSTDDRGAMVTASVDCPPQTDGYDPPPIPGMPGPALVGAGPTSFDLPAEGGSQPITGGVSAGGDGFFNDGVLTVERVR